MVISKLRFLSIVGAELRTEVVATSRPPKFKVTIAETERLIAERAAVWTAVDEISAARNHPDPPSPGRKIRTDDYGGNRVFWWDTS
jgi:hypothetical protein